MKIALCVIAKFYPVWQNVTLCGEMCYLGKLGLGLGLGL